MIADSPDDRFHGLMVEAGTQLTGRQSEHSGIVARDRLNVGF